MSDDYHSIIASAVSRLPDKTDEARSVIYERARAALRETLHNYDPPLSETEIANVQSALDTAIGLVEVDFLVAAMRHAREEAAPSPPSLSFIPRVKEFVRSIVQKFKSTYKFQLGQTVFLSPSLGVPGGACIVKRKLPEREGEFEYRVKSANELHERVARESELSDVP
jgi:hypothetical protein